MDELVGLLVELVKTATPVMWQAAYKQVYVRAIHEALWGVMWIILFFVTRRASSYLKDASQSEKKTDRFELDWKTEQYIFSCVLSGCSILFIVFIIANIGTIVGLLINPEYYAIELLSDLVR